MVWHYQATIFDLRLTDLAKNCLEAFGSIKNQAIKKEVVAVIKNDLIAMMDGVVSRSLDYFGKKSGRMASSLKKGIQVKGTTPVSLRAILHGVDYTLLHEKNAEIKPIHARMLAIPLPSACHADGTPILKGGPKLWKNYKDTFIINGATAEERGLIEPTPSDINPHESSEVAYVAYRDKSRGHEHVVFLYKLVPYSLFKEGYKNVNDEPLKKLYLERRMKIAISRAWAGWAKYIMDAMERAQDWEALTVYKDIYLKTVQVNYKSTGEVPSGAVPDIAAKSAGLVSVAIKIGRS